MECNTQQPAAGEPCTNRCSDATNWAQSIVNAFYLGPDYSQIEDTKSSVGTERIAP